MNSAGLICPNKIGQVIKEIVNGWFGYLIQPSGTVIADTVSV
jgi:hypothetical protein